MASTALLAAPAASVLKEILPSARGDVPDRQIGTDTVLTGGREHLRADPQVLQAHAVGFVKGDLLRVRAAGRFLRDDFADFCERLPAQDAAVDRGQQVAG